MDLRRSDDDVPATCLKKGTFQMSHQVVFKREDGVTPCGTSECKVEQASSTAWALREGHPQEEKEGQQTILSEAKEELPGS